jgi:serine/threonine protein kinase
MSLRLVCSNGHSWQVANEPNGDGAPCPTCGELGQSSEQGAAFAQVPKTEPLDAGMAATLPPSPGRPISSHAKPTIPGFEILRELGRGGMGVVYLARQEKLERLVALKMVLGGEHADERDRARLLAEAKAIARLQQPNIVQLLEVGEVGGRLYFSLEFVDGGSLAETLDGTPWHPRDAVATLIPIARAIDYAHGMGILHRDLKPANLLIAEPHSSRMESNGRSASSESKATRIMQVSQTRNLKITDFGLAKNVDGSDAQTQTGVVMGTPSYMAPEQAAGHSRTAGPGVDIYALGAILYELLTGRPPFRGETPLDTMMQALSEEPVRPTRLQPKIPRDLETICLKCLQKDPRKRFASAGELADDMQRFLDGKPIQARAIGPLGRGWRWAKRNPIIAGLVSLFAMTLLIGFVVVVMLWRRAEHEHRQTLKQEARAKANLLKATQAVDRLLASVTDERLAYVPQFEDERRKILEDAVNFYKDFLEQETDDPILRREMARACNSLGKVFMGLGRSEQSRDTYEQAVRLQDQLVAENPNDAALHNDLAQSLLGLASANRILGQVEQAEPLYRRARDLTEELVHQFPDDANYRASYAQSLGQLGYQHLQSGRVQEADKCYRDSIAQWDQVVAAKPGDFNHSLSRAKAYQDLAFYEYNTRQLAVAEKNIQQAIGMLETLQKHFPRHRRAIESSLATARLTLASVLVEANHPDQSGEVLQKVTPVFERLVRDYPMSPMYRFGMAQARQTAALQNRMTQKPKLAEQDLQEAIDLLGELYKTHPEAFYYAIYLQRAYVNLIQLHLSQNKIGQAAAEIDKVKELVEKDSRQSVMASYGKIELAVLMVQAANQLKAAGKGADALKYLDQAIAGLPDQKRLPTQAAQLVEVATIVRALVEAQTDKYKDAVAVARKHLNPLPKSPDQIYNLACVFSVAAKSARSDANVDTPTREKLAEEYLVQAGDLIRQLFESKYFEKGAHVPHIWRDEDLESLRADPEFRKWLEANLPIPKNDK